MEKVKLPELEEVRAVLAEKANAGHVARSFLDMDEMPEEIWERFVKAACVYPDGRIEIRWNFGDEMEEDA